MHDIRKPDTPVTIMAERGQVTQENGQPQLIVFNGKRQEMNIATGQLSQLAFDQYVLDINSLVNSNSAMRMPDPREQTVDQLIDPSSEMLSQRATRERLMAELNQRLTTPLLAFSYTLIGVAAILSGEFNRRGMSRRILVAAAAIILVQVANMTIASVIVRDSWLTFALYIAALAPAVLGIALLNIERLRSMRSPSAPALTS